MDVSTVDYFITEYNESESSMDKLVSTNLRTKCMHETEERSVENC